MAFFKNILVSIAVVTVAAGTVSATPVDASKPRTLLPRNGCYSGGESYVSAGFATDSWIVGACAAMEVSYSPSQTVSSCVTGSNPSDRVNLSVENTSGDSASLTQATYVAPFLFLKNYY